MWLCPSTCKKSQGATELHDWFGYWPTFHNAEILSVLLNEKTAQYLRIHTWEMTGKVDKNGYHVLAKDVVIEFVFEAISDLTLTGFNQQNVIFGLAIKKTDSGFRLTLDECYGLAGSIET